MITVSSSVWSGATPLETAWGLMEVTPGPDGQRRTMKEELERIGFLGDVPASHEAQPIAAHFELHIEQGPVLEAERRKIGVVTGGQAYKWFEVLVRGRDSHAGTTPMFARKDAALAAAKMIVESNRIAKRHAGLITTGLIETVPGSVNTMAHTVRFTIDTRHPSDAALGQIEDECRTAFEQIARDDSEQGVVVEWRKLTENPAVTFHADCVSLIEDAARETCRELPTTADDGRLWKHMVSGAGHDSFHVSRICPTGMIFTPTKDGLSHTPTEYCSPEDCALGAQVLLGAVLRYDRLRAERGLLE
jgi:hydantoinase/carbamoylase family amidase